MQGLALGDHVVIDPLTACGHCYACRVGRYNVCRELKVLAAHVDGGFRQFFTVRAANVHKISPSVPWEHAACVEPYTIAAEATQRGELRADDAVLICGAGPIGATILQVAKRVGRQGAGAGQRAGAPGRHAGHGRGRRWSIPPSRTWPRPLRTLAAARA